MSRSLLSVLFAALTFSTAAFALTEADKNAIAERIKPVGDVYLAGSEPVQAAPTGPRDGATVYGTFVLPVTQRGSLVHRKQAMLPIGDRVSPKVRMC